MNHFVDDEHFCYFDDMYSPEYFVQWIYEGIMKYDIDQDQEGFTRRRIQGNSTE